MSRLCTSCGNPYEPRSNCGSEQQFCSKDCRQNFHAACRIWGQEAYGTGEVSIFQLRTCLGRRTRRAQRDLAVEGTQPETGACTGEPLRVAAPVSGNAP